MAWPENPIPAVRDPDSLILSSSAIRYHRTMTLAAPHLPDQPDTPRVSILIVEDDPGIAGGLVQGLKTAGYEVELCTDGAAAAQKLPGGDFDFVILDLMLPERDGFSLLRDWHTRTSVPVLVLTARTDLEARLRSFQLGAVDWMSKPFFMEELLARIETRLELAREQPAKTICWNDAELDLDRRAVRVAGTDVQLTAHEFNILLRLVQEPGRVLSRAQLSDTALPLGGDRDERTVNSHIARIRKKLGAAGQAVHTVRGVGYCFEFPGGRP